MDIQDFLRGKGVGFELIRHEEAYAAQEVAASEHVAGSNFAKTVIVNGKEASCMLVLPATHLVDLDAAGQILGEEVQLANEQQMKQLFPDCEVGAEPPFGSQYGLKTVVDVSLQSAHGIVFRAGSHTETIRIAYEDYERIENPRVARFAHHAC